VKSSRFGDIDIWRYQDLKIGRLGSSSSPSSLGPQPSSKDHSLTIRPSIFGFIGSDISPQ